MTDPGHSNGHELVRRLPAGAVQQPQVIRRFLDDAPVAGPQRIAGDNAGLPSEVLDELVAEVASLIEQRVVDELERRGRRHSPEVF